MSGRKFSRRQFFRLKPWDVLHVDRDDTQTAVGPVFRPPGALPEPQFLETCTRSGECIRACPHDVLFPLDVRQGEQENTPSLDPNHQACRWCSTLDCLVACSSGALSEREGTVRSIGVVELDTEACLSGRGGICDNCANACPSHLRAITMAGIRPRLDADLCTGCGLCVDVCPSNPRALVVRHEVPAAEGSEG